MSVTVSWFCFSGFLFLGHVLATCGGVQQPWDVFYNLILHPRLTSHCSGSDVFGSDICTWYVQTYVFQLHT